MTIFRSINLIYHDPFLLDVHDNFDSLICDALNPFALLDLYNKMISAVR